MPANDNLTDLDFDQIQRDATEKFSLLKLRDQLQEKVDSVYPGYKVTLSKNGAVVPHARKPVDFMDLTQSKQIETVLVDGPMELRRLYKEIRVRGGKMGFQSLMSLLSAGKRAGKFRSFGRGIWGLPKDILTATEVFDSFENLEEKK